MAKLTKKALIALMNGKNVVRTLTNAPSYEERDQVLQQFRDLVEAHGITDPVVVDLDKNTVSAGSRVYLLPLLRKVESGVLHFRSSDYFFAFTDPKGQKRESFGAHTTMTVLPDATEKAPAFSITMLNGGVLTYRLAD